MMPFVGHGLLLAATAATLFGLVVTGKAHVRDALSWPARGGSRWGWPPCWSLPPPSSCWSPSSRPISASRTWCAIPTGTCPALPGRRLLGGAGGGPSCCGSGSCWWRASTRWAGGGAPRARKRPTGWRRHGARSSSGIALFLSSWWSPSARLSAGSRRPADGRGLNPLLQNPGMLIHPVTLYLG